MSQTLDKHWDFNKSDFQKHGYNNNGGLRYNPDLAKAVTVTAKCDKFTYYKSYYVENAAFIF